MNQKDSEINVPAIIEEVMKSEGVDLNDIREEEPFDIKKFLESFRHRKMKSMQYYLGYTSGEFDCECGHSWKSALTWCIIDLKNQELHMRIAQRCKKRECKKEVEPHYTASHEKSVKRMIEWAVNLYLVKTGKKQAKKHENNSLPRQGKHHTRDCKMCDFTYEIFWKPCFGRRF